MADQRYRYQHRRDFEVMRIADAIQSVVYKHWGGLDEREDSNKQLRWELVDGSPRIEGWPDTICGFLEKI